MATTFSNKVEILAELWSNYKDNDEFTDFIEYNDLGLPLAYLIKENLCTVTSQGESYIEETFDLLIESVSLDDTGFESLNDIFTSVQAE
jgi:hypothetical protein